MLIRNHLRYIAIAVIFISAILFHTTTTFAQHPCDNFPVTTCTIPSSFPEWSLQDNNTSATGQVGEPSYGGWATRKTLWYKWTAPQNGRYIVDTRGTNPNNTLNVDTTFLIFRGGGTFAGLTLIANSDEWGDGGCFSYLQTLRGTEDIHSSCTVLQFTAGTTYHFQFDNYSGGLGTPGLFYLNVRRFVPTAATSSINGRVTNDYGRGVSRTLVTLTDINGIERAATTNQFGYYRFTEVESGQNYILSAQRKGYQFENNPRVLNVNEDLTGEDFIGANPFTQRE